MQAKAFLLVLFVPILCAESLWGWPIEAVSGPQHSGLDGAVHRSTVFLENDTIWYGRCNILEKRCAPDSDSLELLRQQSFEQYQTRLAELFGIEAKYLIHHEKTRENYDRLLLSLQEIIEGDAEEAEKQKATQKRDAIKAKDGLRDRFLQAVAIKESLDRKKNENGEEIVVTFEKSQKQFSQSLWPINFARLINKPEGPLKRLEPSTEFLWFFGAKALNRKQAKDVCGRVAGGRLASLSEMEMAAKWLNGTELWEAIPQETGTHSEQPVRKVWLDWAGTRERLAGTEQKEVGTYIIKTIEVEIRVHDCVFEYAYLFSDGTVKRYSYDVKTSHRDPIHDPVGVCGGETPELPVLCVMDPQGSNHQNWSAR
ncbi:MAG: hypothetical protein KDD51_10925 [Bdellovibrionales bacterium]|nr:hypothetical protein [Bdellovibrionales bacterium]